MIFQLQNGADRGVSAHRESQRVFIRGHGQPVPVLVFAEHDLSSGELLVVIRDKRRIGNQMWGRANTVTASSDVRTLFNSWSNQLLSRVTGK